MTSPTPCHLGLKDLGGSGLRVEGALHVRITVRFKGTLGVPRLALVRILPRLGLRLLETEVGGCQNYGSLLDSH